MIPAFKFSVGNGIAPFSDLDKKKAHCRVPLQTFKYQ